LKREYFFAVGRYRIAIQNIERRGWLSWKLSPFLESMTVVSFVVKELLKDIERSNTPRQDFDLRKLVNNKVSVYGASGSDLRRAVQKKFDQVRRKPPKSYSKLLDSFQIPRGTAFERELRVHREKNGGGNDDDESEDESEDDSEDESEDKDEEANETGDSLSSETSFSSSERGSDRKNVSKPKIHSKIHSKTQSSKVSALKEERTLTSGFKRLSTKNSEMLSPVSLMSSSLSSSSCSRNEESVLANVKQLEGMQLEGTEEFPFIIIANIEKPERNHGFEISLVPNIEVNGFTRDSFHIRKVTSPPQANDWSATIPKKKFPSLAHRAILIRGPSQDYWHQDANRYHKDNLMECAVTKRTHEALQTAITDDGKRAFAYWLIVFPEHILLENHIWSGDSTNIKKDINDMQDKFLNVDENINILGIDVYWRVAISGGEKIRQLENNGTRRKLFGRSPKT
jgi:hypothetical protein